MPLPPWSIEFLRRSLDEVATRSGKPEAIEKIKQQATEILQDLPQSAARGIDAVLRGAEAGKKSVERWTRKHTQLCRPVINGSGVLFHPQGSGVEIYAEILDSGCDVLTGGHSSGDSFTARVNDRLQRSLDELDGFDGYRVIVASNLDAAVASLAAITDDGFAESSGDSRGANRTLAIHRSDAVRLPSDRSLPDVLNTFAGPRSQFSGVHEVGSSNQRDANDFASVRDACVISADVGQPGGGPFGGLRDDAIQVCVAPYHPFTTPAPLDDSATSASGDDDAADVTDPLSQSAQSLLQSGIDLVIVSGDGFIGGPSAGILIGRSGLIGGIERSATWPVLKASDAVVAMVATALSQRSADSDDEEIGEARLGKTDLVRVSEDNLKARSERIATRVSGSDSIESVKVDDADAVVVPNGRWSVASRQLCLKHRDQTAEQWQSDLANDLPEILCDVRDGLLVVDLRWISPAKDADLAEALVR